MKRFLLLIVYCLLIVNFMSGQLIITEIADPNDELNCRYVEIYNPTSSAIDLAADGWQIQRWTNGNTDPQAPEELTGTISAGGFYIVCRSSSDFSGCFGPAACDQELGTGGPADSNGDDHIAILDCNGTIVDLFGNPGTDGTGEWHEFEDGRAERVSTVCSPVSSPDQSSNWDMCSDANQSGCDEVNSGDSEMTPGAWSGAATCNGLTYTAPTCAGSCVAIPSPCTTGSASISIVPGAFPSSTQSEVDALDDAWFGTIEGIANCPSGTTFELAYGAIAASGSVGEIAGLLLPDGTLYSGSVTFTLNDGIEGCECTGNQGNDTGNTASQTFSTSTSGMQGDSPKPTGIGTHYSENSGAPNTPNLICINLSVPVEEVGFWIGDVESSTTNPGKIHTYGSAGCLLSSQNIPTGTLNESNCTGSTGTAGFDGCGNDETAFVAISGSQISQICIEVGDFPDDDTAPGGTEHISFGGFSLGGECVMSLPVEFSNFTAQLNNNTSDLTWTTAIEQNNEMFVIEHSTDGKTFVEVGIVRGAGNSQVTSNYFFKHEKPVAGLNYYRIKQLDFDGQFSYSAIEVLRMVSGKEILIRPSLATNRIELVVDKPFQSDIEIEVYTLTGQKVHDSVFQVGQTHTSIDISDLRSGQYLIRLNSNENTYTSRFVKL